MSTSEQRRRSIQLGLRLTPHEWDMLTLQALGWPSLQAYVRWHLGLDETTADHH